MQSEKHVEHQRCSPWVLSDCSRFIFFRLFGFFIGVFKIGTSSSRQSVRSSPNLFVHFVRNLICLRPFTTLWASYQQITLSATALSSRLRPFHRADLSGPHTILLCIRSNFDFSLAFPPNHQVQSWTWHSWIPFKPFLSANSSSYTLS